MQISIWCYSSLRYNNVPCILTVMVNDGIKIRDSMLE